MAIKRKRKSKTFSNSNKKIIVQTPEQLRAQFPKELIDAYMNLHYTKAKVKHKSGFEYYEWTDKAYAAYVKEAIKYLGESKYNEYMEADKLVIHLARATMDLRENKNGEQKKSKKKTKVRTGKA